MMKITSVQNEKVKQVLKLKDKKYRDLTGLFIVEGYHLVEEAYQAKLLDAIFVTNQNHQYTDITTYLVDYEVITKLSSTKTPQEIIGVVTMMKPAAYQYKRYLLLDGVQDPGNLGTIIRSALGFGIEAILLGNDCVDLYNEKVVRATQGAMFHIPFIKDEMMNIVNALKRHQIPIYATTLTGAININQVTIKDSYALVFGNEGSGVKPEILKLADHLIYIDTHKQLESLNVGVAASIIMYEFDKKMKG